ncbi:MAG: Pr6Pr family membrane protein [Caulobacteraceae bacterium]|nr:Pr6Pr family membrane protein [Caulobacteraceae bacterium]
MTSQSSVARVPLPPFGRWIAAGIAAIAWLGEGLFFAETLRDMGGDVAGALWSQFGYLTDLSNLAVAIVFTGIALGRPRFADAGPLGAVTTTIVVVGVGYAALGGWDGLLQKPAPDIIGHAVTPILTALFWVSFVRFGHSRPSHIGLWITPMVLYFAYAFARGALTGEYAYPFIDVNAVGWSSALLFAGAMVGAAAIVAAVMLGLNRMSARSP